MKNMTVIIVSHVLNEESFLEVTEFGLVAKILTPETLDFRPCSPGLENFSQVFKSIHIFFGVVTVHNGEEDHSLCPFYCNITFDLVGVNNYIR